jgi:hypothetical protein
MALGFYFTPSSFTPAQYDDAISRLEAAGAQHRQKLAGAARTYRSRRPA